MGWDADAHHATRHGQLVKYRDGMPEAHQVEGGRQAGRTGTNDGNFLSGEGGFMGKGRADDGLIAQIRQFIPVGISPIGDETLETHDVDCLVNFTPAAGVFTTVVAHPPANRGEGMLTADSPVSVSIAFLADQGDIALGALVGRAGCPAGSHPVLLNGVGIGDGLRRVAVGGLAHTQPQVKGIGNLDRANLGALSAASTQALIDIARLAPHAHVVVTDKPGDRLNFAVAQQVDVLVASDGHHFRSEYSGSTV